MFVGERMSRPVISVAPETPVHDALAMFKKEHIRRAPVIKDGKLLGIVTENDLRNASPSPATTLSVWEMNYLISKVTVKDVMTKSPMTIKSDRLAAEAFEILRSRRIDELPVVDDKKRPIGLLDVQDLLKAGLV